MLDKYGNAWYNYKRIGVLKFKCDASLHDQINVENNDNVLLLIR